MTETAHPRFFWQFPMRLVREARLAEFLPDDGRLRILFLWGKDCPNCDIAKGQMLLAQDRFSWPDVEWLHDNVYEDPGMATRFGLHGIPAFFVFRGGKKLGRIGQWPGTEAFVAAIEKLRLPAPSAA
ncbi:thioredoxin family protein [Lysobacter sp. BMK333-48F3]|uniref:thioredoxin family protein n=1 Tax=Lysobacter sp. BMK333-48F3 TaxID=2867962 RepID=UPI001C8B6FCE|nr:thioredoxin family protein [Lysobacter sp. BMK333-48F3]MBX9399703.1 thioredoxin family protein [Lysobacter sp. BMK333-48F3]